MAGLLTVGVCVLRAAPSGADTFFNCQQKFQDLWYGPHAGMSVQAAPGGGVTITVPPGDPLMETTPGGDAGGQQVMIVPLPDATGMVLPIPTKTLCESYDPSFQAAPWTYWLVTAGFTMTVPGYGSGAYGASLWWRFADGSFYGDGAGASGSLQAWANLTVPVQDSDADGVPDVSDRCPYEAGSAAYGGCASDPADRLDVVSLGDSYSSGEGAPPFDSATNQHKLDECHRSQSAWGPQFAQWLAKQDSVPLALQFRACSGALIPDLYGPNHDWKAQEPGQVLALTPDTDVVTLSIGGNDSGFVPVFSYCVAVDHCNTQAVLQTDDGLGGDRVDRTYNAMFGTLESVYETVKARAPNATVYVMGYPDILPDTDPGLTCPDVVGLDWGEIQWLHQKVVNLDAVIRTAAQRAGVVYVDGSDVLKDHKLCSQTPWASGLTAKAAGLVNWSTGRYVFHPNAAGHAAMAKAVEDAPLANPVPDPTAAVTGSIAEPVDLAQLGYFNGIAQHLRDWDTQFRNWTDDVKATVSGWLAHSPLHLDLHSSSPISLGSFNADANGNANIDFQLPDTADIGFHTVTITGTAPDGTPRVLLDDLYFSAADLVPAVTTSGNVVPGGNVTFAIGVTNEGRGASVGPINVDIAPDSDLTYGAPTGSGWSCATQSNHHLLCSTSTAVGPSQTLPVLHVTGAIAAKAAAGSRTDPVQLTGGNDDYGANNTTGATWAIAGVKPSAPQVSAVSAGDGWVSVAWNPQGSSPADHYTVKLTPGNAATTVPAPGTRAVIQGLSDGVAYRATVTATNSAGTSSPSAASSAVTPHAGSASVTTKWTAAELSRLAANAAYFGSSQAAAQKTSTGILAYIDGLLAPGVTPIAPPPANTGPTSVTTSWGSGEQPVLLEVCRRYALSPAEAQKFAVQVIGFLLALSGH